MITSLPNFRETTDYGVEVNQSMAFMDTVGAMNSVSYQPFIDAYKNRQKHGYEIDPSYDPLPDIDEGYRPYLNTLILAQNAEHMADLKVNIDRGVANRRVLANSGFWAQAGAGLFDPINLIPLPFGGAGIGIVKSALRTGASVGVLQAGLEIAKSPFDPVQTMEEGLTHTGMAAVSGAFFGAAFSIPATRRNAAYNNHMKSHISATERQQDFENLAALSNEELAAARSTSIRKQFEGDSTKYLNAEVKTLRDSTIGPQGPMPLSVDKQARPSAYGCNRANKTKGSYFRACCKKLRYCRQRPLRYSCWRYWTYLPFYTYTQGVICVCS